MGNDVRRRDPRFKKNMVVVMHRPYTEKRVETANVSLGGAALHNVERYYHINQIVYIEIKTAETDSIYCSASVISVYPHSAGASTYKINLRFIDMSDADKEKLKTALTA